MKHDGNRQVLSRKKEARSKQQQSQIAAIGKLSAVNQNQDAEIESNEHSGRSQAARNRKQKLTAKSKKEE